MHTYTPRGVCSRAISVELDGDRVSHVEFAGGCDGNLKAVSKLVRGMAVDDVAALLEGNTCGRRSTSCADQLVRALRSARRPSRPRGCGTDAAPCRSPRSWPCARGCSGRVSQGGRARRSPRAR